MGLKILLSVMLLFPGCIQQNHSKMKSVFGTDDRKTLSNENPFQGVLKVKDANGGTCTAFMVGPRIALSAGHCTEGLKDGGTLSATFHDSALTATTMRLLERASKRFTGYVYDDWAIFVLEGASSAQWFGAISDLAPGDALHLCGYSVDMSGATTTDHCSAREIKNDVIFHDCNMQAGASGGPIFIQGTNGNWIAVGIQSGHVSDSNTAFYPEWTMAKSNLGVKISKSLIDKILLYREKFQ